MTPTPPPSHADLLCKVLRQSIENIESYCSSDGTASVREGVIRNLYLITLFHSASHFRQLVSAEKKKMLLQPSLDTASLEQILFDFASAFSLPLPNFDGACADIPISLYHLLLDTLGKFKQPLSPVTPGILYEQFAHNTDQKKQGLFYTPPDITKLILQFSFPEELQENFRPRLLDPSCGAGIFLILALNSLAQQTPGLQSDFDELMDLATYSLHGIDRDSVAVSISRFTVLLAICHQANGKMPTSVPTEGFETQIQHGNSLLGPEHISPADQIDAPELDLFSWQEAFPAAMSEGGFDIIAGNPPYGISRDSRIPPLENRMLKKAYAHFQMGKVNTYLAFIARSLEFLKEQGKLVMIIPNSWHGIKSGRAFRKMMLEQGALTDVVVFQDDVFCDPSVEATIIKLCPDAGTETLEIYSARAHPKIRLSSPLSVSSKDCLGLPDAVIPLTWTAHIRDVWTHILNTSTTIETNLIGYRPMIALQAYARGRGEPPQTPEDVREHIFHSAQKESAASYPYLSGKDIARYGLRWSGLFLQYGPWLAEPQSLERFQGPRIAVREITGTMPNLVRATFLDETYLYNKSVLHILPVGSCSKEELLALLAILNSSFASFILHTSGRKSQRRLFPKIVADDLKHFPLPEKLGKFTVDLASAAAKMLKRNDDSTLDREINELVYETYELSRSHRRVVENVVFKKTPSDMDQNQGHAGRVGEAFSLSL